jgi:hypothetical protein
VLWKLATALGVELEALLTRQVARAVTVLRREQAHISTLSEGKFVSRSLGGPGHAIVRSSIPS